MRRKFSKLLAFSLSIAIAGTSVPFSYPITKVKAASTSESADIFSDLKRVSDDSDLKFNSSSNINYKHPEHWGILDGDTSITHLGTMNEDGDYSGVAGSGIVTWQNNRFVTSKDMGNFKFKFDYFVKKGTSDSRITTFNKGYTGNGNTFTNGEVCGFSLKPLYASSEIDIYGVSPYKNYTTDTNKGVVIKASAKDLEKMSLEYYGTDLKRVDPEKTVDLSAEANDDGVCTFKNKGWYYLNYEDEGYYSDGMGDEVTGGTASKDKKGQLFGFSFYIGGSNDTCIQKMVNPITITKKKDKLEKLTINTKANDLTRAEACVTKLGSGNKSYTETYQDTKFVKDIDLSSFNTVVATVRAYYQCSESDFYKTLTNVSYYYSNNDEDNYSYKDASKSFVYTRAGEKKGYNYLPTVIRDDFGAKYSFSDIVLSRKTYNGHYTFKYELPDSSKASGKNVITKEVIADYTDPYLSVVTSDGKWTTIKSDGTYKVKNGASVTDADEFSTVFGIDAKDLKYTFMADGKTPLTIDGETLGIEQESLSGSFNFSLVRNTEKFITKEDNILNISSKVGVITDGLSDKALDEALVKAKGSRQTYTYDIADNNTGYINRDSRFDSVKCTITTPDGKKEEVKLEPDLTKDGLKDTKNNAEISKYFDKVGTYELELDYATAKNLSYPTEEDIKNGASESWTIGSKENYKGYATVVIEDKKIYDADKVVIDFPELVDTSGAKNTQAPLSCTMVFEDGTATNPTDRPTSDTQKDVTDNPSSTEEPSSTEQPSTTEKPTATTESPSTTETPNPLEGCNLQNYLSDGTTTVVNDSMTLTWNKAVLDKFKSNYYDAVATLSFVDDDGNATVISDNDDYKVEGKDLYEYKIDSEGLYRFRYYDGRNDINFSINYEKKQEPAPLPSTTEVPATTEAPTEAPSEKVDKEELSKTPVDSDGNPLKQVYVNGVTIYGISEDIDVKLDGDVCYSRPISVTEKGKHILSIEDKSYIFEIVSEEDRYKYTKGTVEIPSKLTITEGMGEAVYVDGVKVSSFPYVIDTVGEHSIDIENSSVDVALTDSDGNPVMDDNGKQVVQTVRNITDVYLYVLPVSNKIDKGLEYTLSDFVKKADELNETLSAKGSLTLTGIKDSKVVYLDKQLVNADSKGSLRITDDGVHYLTIYNTENKSLKTILVTIDTNDVSIDDIKDKDVIIVDDSATIKDIPDDSTVIIDGKEDKNKPPVISGGGKHDVVIKDKDGKETEVTVVIKDDKTNKVDKDDINDIISSTPEDKTPVVKGEEGVIIDVPDNITVIVDGDEVKERPIIIKDDGKHEVIIKDPSTGEEKKIDVVIGDVITKDDIKDITDKTPEGETPVIKKDDKVIIDVDDNTTVIVDGNEVKEKPVVIKDEGKHEVVIKDPTTGEETKVDVVIGDVITKNDIKDIIDKTPEGETPVIKKDDKVIIDVDDKDVVIVDGNEVKERPVIIKDEGKHNVIIKDTSTGEEKRVDVIIGNVVTKDDIKDIIDKTPEGETPVIKKDDEIIIDVPDGSEVIIDGEVVTERPIKIKDDGKHEVVIKDPSTGEETKVDVIIDKKDNKVDKGDIKDIVDKTPEGETPVIKKDDKVIIDVDDKTTVIVDGEEVKERPVVIDKEGKHEVIIKDPTTGEETKVDVVINNSKKDPSYNIDDVVNGNITDKPSKDDSSKKDDTEGNETGTGSKTDVTTPEKPNVSYINGIVDNGIYINGVKIVNNGFTVYITKDDGERKTYTNSLIELTEAGKYKIEAARNGEIKYTFNIEIIKKSVDTSKTETVTKDTIKDGGVYEGGITIKNDDNDTIYVDGKPIIGNPVTITDPGSHDVVIDGKEYTVIIPDNTKPDGGTDTSKPSEPIEIPDTDKIVDGEVYPGGVVIPKPGNGETVIIDGKVITDFPYVIKDDGSHTIKIGDEEKTIYVKNPTIPDIPTIDTGKTPSPSPSAPTNKTDNKDKDKNNSSNNNGSNVTSKPSISANSGSVSGVKNKKAYKKSVKVTLKNVKSGSVSYKKSKKAKAKVSKFGTGIVIYRATKQGIYTVNVVFTDGSKKTITFTVDKKKPSISVKSGKKYKRGTKVKVKDKLSGVKKVTLNGKKCKANFKLNKKGKNIICVWDKAGNKKTVKVKVK